MKSLDTVTGYICFLVLEKILKSLLLEFGCLVQTEENTNCVLIEGNIWQNVVFLEET